MKKHLLVSVALLGFCGITNAGVYFGMPGAVKAQVDKLDQKIADARAEQDRKAALPSYPANSTIKTTLESTVIPVAVPAGSPLIGPNEVAKFAQYGYGVWQTGPALAVVKSTDIMASGYTPAANTARLLHFFTMSDVHITDVQCPANLMVSGLTNAGNSSAYSPVMPYTTQVLDAAIQTANGLHAKQSMDFGLFLGDASNNAVYNELRWYIDTIDGKTINPNSDPVNTYSTDYMRTFKTAGLDKTIPWYQTIGNHDHLYLGTWAQSAQTMNTAIGEIIINVGLNPANPILGTGFYGGVVNSSTTYGEVTGAGPEANFPTPPHVEANPDRRSIPKTAWISEFFKTTSGPVGHGFDKNNISFPCYSFTPKATLPIKVIVLDDTEKDDVAGMGGAAGFLDQTRYNWLVSELDSGQAADQLMVIAAHVPILPGLWDPSSTPTMANLITKLHTYPNLLMWVSGHLHRNVITAIPSTDAGHPELGFWMVETPSLRDFAQQFRLFDIMRNSDNTISIVVTDVDPAVATGSPAETSRSYSVAASQLFTTSNAFPPVNTPSHAYNAELFKQLTPAMQLKIQNYGTPVVP
jgi:metallophosphoesterase (TIGR03768 family)